MKLATYIINLPAAAKRRKNIQSNCEQFPFLDYIIIDAVAGSSLSYHDAIASGYNQSKRHKLYADLELNEIACILSHRNTLDIFIKTGASHCLILEDDALLLETFGHTITTVLANTSGWDLLKLECRDTKMRGFQIGQLSESNFLYSPFNSSHGSTAILYSRNGAKKLRASMDDFFHPFDMHIGTHHYRSNLVIAQVFPSIVHESNQESREESTIGFRRSKRRAPGFAAFLRRRLDRIVNSIAKRFYCFLTISKITIADKYEHPLSNNSNA